MGIDLVGYRGCALQHEHGPSGFLERLKLDAYRRCAEAHFESAGTPEAERARLVLRVGVEGEAREVTYAELLGALGSFPSGSRECGDCPLSGGEALGCYRYVTYPLDEALERRLFEFFARDVRHAGSGSQALYRELLPGLEPAACEAWAAGVAEPQATASLTLGETTVTSKQLLTGLLGLDHGAEGTLPLAARFLAAFAEDLLRGRVAAGEVDVERDRFELTVDGDAWLDVARSRTLAEILEMASLFVAVSEHPGWTVLWDG